MSYEIDASRDLEAEMLAYEVKAKEIRADEQNLLKEFEVAKRKWSKARFPTKEKLETIEKIAMELRTELPHLRNIQPKCWEESDYDKAFSSYIVLVEKSVSKKRHALMLLEDFASLEVDRKRRGIQRDADDRQSGE